MNQWLYYNWGLHVFYVFIVFVWSLHVDPVSPVNGVHRHSSLSLQIHTISMQGLYYWPVSSSKLEADNSQLACVDSFVFMNIDKIHYVSIFYESLCIVLASVSTQSLLLCKCWKWNAKIRSTLSKYYLQGWWCNYFCKVFLTGFWNF